MQNEEIGEITENPSKTKLPAGQQGKKGLPRTLYDQIMPECKKWLPMGLTCVT